MFFLIWEGMSSTSSNSCDNYRWRLVSQQGFLIERKLVIPSLVSVDWWQKKVLDRVAKMTILHKLQKWNLWERYLRRRFFKDSSSQNGLDNTLVNRISVTVLLHVFEISIPHDTNQLETKYWVCVRERMKKLQLISIQFLQKRYTWNCRTSPILQQLEQDSRLTPILLKKVRIASYAIIRKKIWAIISGCIENV